MTIKEVPNTIALLKSKEYIKKIRAAIISGSYYLTYYAKANRSQKRAFYPIL